MTSVISGGRWRQVVAVMEDVVWWDGGGRCTMIANEYKVVVVIIDGTRWQS